jgi:hypothetical protein
MNTYFDVGNERFESREKALEKIKKWNADTTVFHIHEVANTEVTRRTAKGNVLTELVRGSIDAVPRIISARELNPTYVVLDTDAKPPRYFGHQTYFTTRAEAEGERAKRQSMVEKLAALTEDDIREVHVPSLADILERSGDKIDGLYTEALEASLGLEQLKGQASSFVVPALATLQAEAAKRFGVEKAQEKFDAAMEAFHKAIHFDQLEEEALEKLREDHRPDCWPDSDCRVAGECTYDPTEDEDVEEYLLEHAEEFEVEDGITDKDTVAEAQTVGAAT